MYLNGNVGVTDTVTITVEFGRSTVVGFVRVSEKAKFHVDHRDCDLEVLVRWKILVMERESDDRRWHIGLCGNETLSISSLRKS